MRSFGALPVIILGFSLTIIAAILDYVGGLVLQLGCIIAGDSSSDDLRVRRQQHEDRHYNS